MNNRTEKLIETAKLIDAERARAELIKKNGTNEVCIICPDMPELKLVFDEKYLDLGKGCSNSLRDALLKFIDVVIVEYQHQVEKKLLSIANTFEE